MTETATEMQNETAAAPSIRQVATKLSSGAMFSKILGFVREIFMAHTIGVAALADSFRSSITIILLPLAFLQNESVPAILIPRMQEAGRKGEAAHRLAAMTIALTLIGFILMLITMVITHWLVHTMLSGVPFTEEQLTIRFVHIMALAMPASVAINCLAAGEIALGKTRLTNARASILNVGVILGLGMLLLTSEATMLAIAFTLGFNTLAIWATWALWRDGNLSFSAVRPADIWYEARIFMARLVPFLPLPAAEQSNIWMERLLASRLMTGAIASMDYARTLTESALLMVSQPIGLAVLSQSGDSNIREQSISLTRFVVILMMPASAFVFVFAPDIVQLVFHRGAFDATGVKLTSEALRGISVGLWASTLGWILLRLLNRSNRSTLAAGILVAAYLVNLSVNLTTSQLWQVSEYGVMLLGLGETSRSLVMCFALIFALHQPFRMISIILVGAIPAALMAASGWEIVTEVDGTFTRLGLGICMYVASVLLGIALLAPHVLRNLFKDLMTRKGGHQHD